LQCSTLEVRETARGRDRPDRSRSRELLADSIRSNVGYLDAQARKLRDPNPAVRARARSEIRATCQSLNAAAGVLAQRRECLDLVRQARDAMARALGPTPRADRRRLTPAEIGRIRARLDRAERS